MNLLATFEAATEPLASFGRVLTDILPSGAYCAPQAMGDVLEALLRDAKETFRVKVMEKPEETPS
jgi:hypothetical protein